MIINLFLSCCGHAPCTRGTSYNNSQPDFWPNAPRACNTQRSTDMTTPDSGRSYHRTLVHVAHNPQHNEVPYPLGQHSARLRTYRIRNGYMRYRHLVHNWLCSRQTYADAPFLRSHRQMNMTTCWKSFDTNSLRNNCRSSLTRSPLHRNHHCYLTNHIRPVLLIYRVRHQHMLSRNPT